jgi:peptidoglycan-associated lipoprotein
VIASKQGFFSKEFLMSFLAPKNSGSILSATLGFFCATLVCFSAISVSAQETLPRDNGLEFSNYHQAPRYRESESHPFRIAGYILHPVGWLLREGIFRPLSYFASSTPDTRSVMGYREPYDHRDPMCFMNNETPNCHEIPPLNQLPEGTLRRGSAAVIKDQGKQVFFPDINFDFNARTLSPLGKAQARQLAEMLRTQPGEVKIILQGHTDKKGSEEYNSKLGLDRALAVRGELVAMGLNAERMQTVSFGESQPLRAEDSEEAYAANRRVETKLE